MMALATCGALISTACTAGAPQASDVTPQSTQATQSTPQQVSGDDLKDNAKATTLGLTYIPNVQFAPTYIAEDNGLFTAAGQITNLRHHGSDEGLFTALLAGEEDVVLASGDEALQAKGQGMDLVSIGTYYQRNPVAILVPEASPIKTLADLRGKRIGIPGEYGSSWLGLRAILGSAGMSVKDVTVASIGYTQLAALSSGEVDAIVGFTNNELVWFGSAGQPVRALDHDELPLVSASLITTKEALETRPHAVCALVKATEAGMRRATENPQYAMESTVKRDQTLSNPEAVESARAVLRATTSLFGQDAQTVSAQPDLKRWQDMLTFFAENESPTYSELAVDDVVSERCFTN